MNDLHPWRSQQHHGLRTFHTFQQKLATLSRDEPGQRALCRLLSSLVGAVRLISSRWLDLAQTSS